MGWSGAFRFGTMLVAAFAVAGCGVDDVVGSDEPLERLHGAVDESVLSLPSREPVAVPSAGTVPTGSMWRVSTVLDGRTVEIYQGLERVTATLGGIEVPVDDECGAGLATDSLAFITGGNRPVDVVPATPTDGRIDDAMIRNADGDDLALVMLTLGLARADTAAGFEGYTDAEAAARAERIGIWSDDCQT